jgi:hypothetical protein
MPNDTNNTAGSDCPSTPCSLFRSTWEERDEKMEPVRTPDLFVWACVNTKTGEVEMTGIQPYDDELSENLVEGWEWRRFRLIEANAKEHPTADAAAGSHTQTPN